MFKKKNSRLFLFFICILGLSIAYTFLNKKDFKLHETVVFKTTSQDSKNINPKEQQDRLLSKIPYKVTETYEFIRQYKSAPNGFDGGRIFQNRENLLPKIDLNGNKIQYQEWDINPKKPGISRGAERIITGSDSSAYYTLDHYRSFIKFKP
ncbi:MAG: ribonuclease domain-containing protein [Saprospiraceae bacterium]